MVMVSREHKVDMITDQIKSAIFSLLSQKSTGRIDLTLELYLSQGGLGDAYLITRPALRERIDFKKND